VAFLGTQNIRAKQQAGARFMSVFGSGALCAASALPWPLVQFCATRSLPAQRESRHRADNGEPVGRSIQTASAPNSTERHQRYRFVSKIAHDAVGLEPVEGRCGFVRGSREPDSGARTQPTLPMERGYAERVTPCGTTALFAAPDTVPCSRKCRRRYRHQECLDFLSRIDKNLPPD
jgi:hypothetical protein